MNDRDAKWHDLYRVDLASGTRWLFRGRNAAHLLPLRSRRWRQADQAVLRTARTGGKPLVSMWPQELTARDGLKLVSYLTLPAETDAKHDGKAEKPVPLVLYVHSGPWARDSYGCGPYEQWLANRGYAVLSVNFRGSTGSGKAFTNAGNGEWAGKMHDDLLDAVQWAVKRGVTKPDDVAIMGSYGGYATLVGMPFITLVRCDFHSASRWGASASQRVRRRRPSPPASKCARSNVASSRSSKNSVAQRRICIDISRTHAHDRYCLSYPNTPCICPHSAHKTMTDSAHNAHRPFDASTADRLLELLSNNDDFRDCFQSNPAHNPTQRRRLRRSGCRYECRQKRAKCRRALLLHDHQSARVQAGHCAGACRVTELSDRKTNHTVIFAFDSESIRSTLLRK